jgi:hypothetical protein
MNQQKRYLSYLLRLWQESAGDQPGGATPVWRASLERPQTDQRQGFADLDELFTDSREQTGEACPAGSTERHERKPGTDSQTQED